jgi:hypothetical protein
VGSGMAVRLDGGGATGGRRTVAPSKPRVGGGWCRRVELNERRREVGRLKRSVGTVTGGGRNNWAHTSPMVQPLKLGKFKT